MDEADRLALRRVEALMRSRGVDRLLFWERPWVPLDATSAPGLVDVGIQSGDHRIGEVALGKGLEAAMEHLEALRGKL